MADRRHGQGGSARDRAGADGELDFDEAADVRETRGR